MTNQATDVYKAIASVASYFARNPIAKGRKNLQQGYSFRGIDDIFNSLAGLMAEHKLVILPRCISRETTEKITKSGTALFYVTVEMEFDFVAATDASKHTVRMFGEAMDSGDKATNKAMSAAYKYAAIQTFCIPTEGDNDADAVTHEVKSTGPQKVPTPSRKPTASTQAVTTENVEALLSAEQVAHIKALSASVGKPVADIANAYRKASIDFIEARYFDAIVNRLNNCQRNGND